MRSVMIMRNDSGSASGRSKVWDLVSEKPPVNAALKKADLVQRSDFGRMNFALSGPTRMVTHGPCRQLFTFSKGLADAGQKQCASGTMHIHIATERICLQRGSRQGERLKLTYLSKLQKDRGLDREPSEAFETLSLMIDQRNPYWSLNKHTLS